VILAVGQAADLGVLAGVDVEQLRGGIKAAPDSLRTSHPRIWAGGDVAHGPRNLIDAIADGKRAAASIHAASVGEEADEPGASGVHVELHRRPAFRRLATAYDAIPRQPVPATPSDRRVGFGEVEVGYDAAQARLESLRCLRCFDNVMLEPDLCILCGLCVDVCPTDCITIARADRIGLGTETQSVLLLEEDHCIRCGLCVNRCPPGALSMVHAREVSHV
jgi:ferredoxin